MEDWRDAFIAMSLALGAPPDRAEPTSDPSPSHEKFPAGDKAARAKALAQGLAEIALAIESLEAEVES